MAKVISLSEEAYRQMKLNKNPGESFSDVVMRTLKQNKRPLRYFLGKWPGTHEEAERMKQMIYEDRKKFKTREVKF